MATAAENIQTAIDALAAKIATLYADPKPNYNIDGQSLDWNQYRDSLNKQMSDLLDLRMKIASPFEVRSRVRT